jgi:hypothetical protein
VLALAVAAALVVLLATAPRGPQVTTDSVIYLSTAESVRSGAGLTTYAGTPLTTFPPGFPVAVAGVGEFAHESLVAARIVNAACLALIVVMAWLLLRRHVRSTPLRLAATVGVATAPTLFLVSSAVWSEALFIVLVLAALHALETALEQVDRRRWIAVAGVLAGLALCVRYAGLWLVLAGAVVLLIDRRRARWTWRARRAGLFSIAAGAVVVPVVVRNVVVEGGYPLGPHGTSATPLGQNAADAADGVWHWLVPPVGASELRAEALAALVAGAAVWLAIRRNGHHAGAPSPVPLWPIAAIGLAFLPFLVVSASTEFLDPIGPRLLSPAFVPLLIVAFAALDRLRSRLVRPWTVALLVGVVALWLGAQAQATRLSFSQLRHQGSGYTEPRWRESPLVALLHQREIRPAFSNYTDALFFLTGLRAGCWPSTNVTACAGRGPSLSRLAAPAPAYLAWFSEPNRAGPYVPPRLRARLHLTQLAAVADGRLYRVRLAPAQR